MFFWLYLSALTQMNLMLHLVNVWWLYNRKANSHTDAGSQSSLPLFNFSKSHMHNCVYLFVKSCTKRKSNWKNYITIFFEHSLTPMTLVSATWLLTPSLLLTYWPFSPLPKRNVKLTRNKTVYEVYTYIQTKVTIFVVRI